VFVTSFLSAAVCVRLLSGSADVFVQEHIEKIWTAKEHQPMPSLAMFRLMVMFSNALLAHFLPADAPAATAFTAPALPSATESKLPKCRLEDVESLFLGRDDLLHDWNQPWFASWLRGRFVLARAHGKEALFELAGTSGPLAACSH
jgi:hypothetical protein